MSTSPSDLKIRFYDEVSEEWLLYWLKSKEVSEHDWSNQKAGIHRFKGISAMNKDNTPACSCYLYRTKTQRVILIRAYRNP